MDSNVEIVAPVVGDIGSCVSALLAGIDGDWPAPPADWIDAINTRREANVAKMAPKLMNKQVPMDFHGALGALRTIIKERPDAILVNEGANTLDLARSIIDMYQPRKRLDVGTWGVMGIGMGYAVAAAVETGKPVLAVEGDSAFGFSGMEVETICRYKLPVCVVVFNNSGIYRGTDVNPTGGAILRRPSSSGRPLRQDDGSVRRRRRPCDDARRPVPRRERGHGLRQADPNQRGDRPGGRHREWQHRQPQPAKLGPQSAADAVSNTAERPVLNGRSPNKKRGQKHTTRDPGRIVWARH